MTPDRKREHEELRRLDAHIFTLKVLAVLVVALLVVALVGIYHIGDFDEPGPHQTSRPTVVFGLDSRG